MSRGRAIDGLDIAASAGRGPRSLHLLRSVRLRRGRRHPSAVPRPGRPPALLSTRGRPGRDRTTTPGDGRTGRAPRTRKTPRAPKSPAGSSPIGPRTPRAGRRLGRLLGPQPQHERFVALRLHDLVELRAVIRDEAHALDDDVVHEPASVLAVQAVVDGHLGARLGHDHRLHRRLTAIDRFAHVLHALALIELDLRAIRAIEDLGEELHEFLPLLRGAGIPVRPERAARRVGIVEDVLGDLADLRAAYLGPIAQRRIGQNLDHLIDVPLERIGRGASMGRGHQGEDERNRDRDDRGVHETDSGAAAVPPHVSARRRSDDVVAVQRGDLVLAVAELCEDRVGVLAHVRRRRSYRARRARQRDGQVLHRLLAEARMLDRDREPERLHVRVLEHLLHVVDRAARDARLVEHVHPVRARLGHEHLVELRVERETVLGAVGRRLEARVVDERRRADRLAEPAIHDLPGRRDVDVTVRRLEDAGGNPGGMIVARLRRDFLAERPARRLEVEHPHHRLEQRGVHPLAAAGALALEQRDEDAVREEHARGEIGHGNADAHRALARQAGDRHEAAHALGDLVVARAIAVRARLAEARDAAVHEARVDLAQRLVVDAEAVLDVRAEVLDEAVSPHGQALEDLDQPPLLEDRLRRELWRHKHSANRWAVEVGARDESLLACSGPFTPRVAQVVALDELAYGRGPTLEWLRGRRAEFERYDASAETGSGRGIDVPRAGAVSEEAVDALPTEARRLTRAEAGTGYLREPAGLRFVAAHNEALERRHGWADARRRLTDGSLPLDERSIASYVLLTHRPVNMPDAYDVRVDEQPYVFNPAWDLT